jgi:hypothetical protein
MECHEFHYIIFYCSKVNEVLGNGRKALIGRDCEKEWDHTTIQ